MIPVSFLDVRPGMAVLDIGLRRDFHKLILILVWCAAPGSKTTQLLEAIHADDDTNAANKLTDGLVVANDADYSRSYMLVHQAKRMNSPCLLVTNHDGQEFPRIVLSNRRSNEPVSVLQFDRVLCDVPCSGDGTMRKNKNIWHTWSVGNGNGLHKMQYKILKRGLELLKVGGRLVYSTCSFNPIENEAVVASMLKEAGDAVHLVDVSHLYPELYRSHGVDTWKVMNKAMQSFDSFDPSDEAQKALHPTMFPPTIDEAKSLHLDRCIRVYPFHQNCGGFFVAVLEKTKPFGSIDQFIANRTAKMNRRNNNGNDNNEEEDDEDELEEFEIKRAEASASAEAELKEAQAILDQMENNTKSVEVDMAESGIPKRPKKTKTGWYGQTESPFIFLDENDERAKDLLSFYDISEHFPRDSFVVRTEADEDFYRTIYVVSAQIKRVLTCLDAKKLKVVNTGVKVFKKNGGSSLATGECPYRVSSEGVTTIAPFLSASRQVSLSLDDLCIFIEHEYPKFEKFSEQGRQAIKNLRFGSCLMRFDPKTQPGFSGALSSPIVLPFYRSAVSGSLLLSQKERRSLMHRLTGRDITVFSGMDDAKRGLTPKGTRSEQPLHNRPKSSRKDKKKNSKAAQNAAQNAAADDTVAATDAGTDQ
eukprot:jgi/Hompol1/6364/HPOL_004956-RA